MKIHPGANLGTKNQGNPDCTGLKARTASSSFSGPPGTGVYWEPEPTKGLNSEFQIPSKTPRTIGPRIRFSEGGPLDRTSPRCRRRSPTSSAAKAHVVVAMVLLLVASYVRSVLAPSSNAAMPLLLVAVPLSATHRPFLDSMVFHRQLRELCLAHHRSLGLIVACLRGGLACQNHRDQAHKKNIVHA